MATRKKEKERVKLHRVGSYPVLLQHIPSPTVTVECAINAGFIHESKETAGINHLLEHVVTEAWKKCGTTTCSELWANRGVYMNASTDNTLVQYYTTGTVLHLKDMVRYIADISDHPIFKRGVMVHEKEAVIDELSTYGNDPESKIDGLFNHAAYNGALAYADDWQLQIKNLKHIGLPELKKAYAANYNARNMMFIVTGTFQDADVLALFHQELKKKQSGTLLLPSCFTNHHAILYSHHNSPTTKVVIGFPSEVKLHDDAGAYIGATCGILSNLLFSLLRTKLTLVYGVRFHYKINTCGTMMMCSIYVRDKNAVQCLKALMKELATYTRGFPAMAVAASKERELYAHYKSLPYTGDYLTQYMHQMDTKRPRILSYLDKLKCIKKMTAKTLVPVFNALIQPERALCVYQGPRDLNLKWGDLI